MSGLRYAITDPEVKHAWEVGVEVEARLRDPLLDPENGFAGSDTDSFLCEKDELKSEGAYIISKVQYQLEGIGRYGEQTLKGYEESYKTATSNIYIDVLRHATAVSGPMTAQFISEDALEESKKLMGDWAATRLSLSAHLHGAGISCVTNPAFTLHNTINAVDSRYIIRPGKKSAGDLTANDTFDVDLINNAARLLKMIRPKMRPAKTPWGPKFILWLAPEQVHSLRESDSIWYDRCRAALQGGYTKDNPIWGTAIGEEQGILMMESDFVPPGLDSTGAKLQANTRRAWLGGAQSLMMAYGRGYKEDASFSMNRFQWLTDSDDYGFRRAVALGTILGMSRPRYLKPGNSLYDERVIVIETYVEYPENFTAATVLDKWTAAGVEIA